MCGLSRGAQVGDGGDTSEREDADGASGDDGDASTRAPRLRSGKGNELSAQSGREDGVNSGVHVSMQYGDEVRFSVWLLGAAFVLLVFGL